MTKAFSENNPTLRLAWDSTTLTAFMECPRRYYYGYVEGWRGRGNADIEFGGFYAKAQEHFHKARAAGKSLMDATVLVVRNALNDTWQEREIYDPETDTFKREFGPWGGQYVKRWRCKGETPYKNEKGNRAKCPYSHKGKWEEGKAPSVCQHCGSATEAAEPYIPDHRTKNRETLIRTIVWYCLEQPENYEDGLHAIRFPNGTLAIELSFVMPLPFFVDHGEAYGAPTEPYVLAGHIDKVLQFETDKYIVDDKTTGKALDNAFFRSYSPNVQFDTYDMVGALMFPQLELEGVAVQAAQVSPNSSAFGFRVYRRDEDRREEHLNALRYWIKQAESCAQENYWPQNKAHCRTCEFKVVCSEALHKRQSTLEEFFDKREPWNPLITR